MSAVPPGGTVGILGGGQLGRMLAMAAARLGLKTHIYGPEGFGCPASQVATAHTSADYSDEAALTEFARRVDAVTTEFENVPARAVELLRELTVAHPNPNALSIAQDRVLEKTFLNAAGVETAPWCAVDDSLTLAAALGEIGAPAILKTRRLGYDGKGQARISAAWEAGEAWEAMRGAPSILEGMVAFEREISVIVARGEDGSLACYDPGENHHEAGILRRTIVPAAIDETTRERALEIAGNIVEALDYVGVLGVELFVTRDGRILANEIAPRVHNTGHWTIEGCVVSQFEQHIRAVCGWPLGDPARHSDAEMVNLLGDDAHDWETLAASPGAGVHLYGKDEAKPGRKMGHVTRLSPLGS